MQNIYSGLKRVIQSVGNGAAAKPLRHFETKERGAHSPFTGPMWPYHKTQMENIRRSVVAMKEKTTSDLSFEA